MTYGQALRDLMPAFIDLPPERALALIAALASPGEGFPSGSSFAVTAEPWNGLRRIYFSRNSLVRVEGELRHLVLDVATTDVLPRDQTSGHQREAERQPVEVLGVSDDAERQQREHDDSGKEQ